MDKENWNGDKKNNEMSQSILDKELDDVNGGGPRGTVYEQPRTPNPLPPVGTRSKRANFLLMATEASIADEKECEK